jgi:hypothetical protein
MKGQEQRERKGAKGEMYELRRDSIDDVEL